jgi:uncharacterized glyoxalase superfamily protein PhnB
MNVNRSMPDCGVIPELAYPDVAEAVTWLCEAFGFRERLRIGNHRAQLSVGRCAVIVTEARRDPSAPGDLLHAVMVRVDDVDRHHERAAARGARILRPPVDYPYGERQDTAADPGGHVWTFSQTIADVDPAVWGGTLLET